MPTPSRRTISAPVFVGLLAAGALAQEAKLSCGYPDRNVLTPFRAPAEIAAPPDALFAQLRTMRRIADDPAAVKHFDERGREIVDDETWRIAFDQVERIGLDAGMLAVQMRQNRNPDERALAFYAAFYCANVDYVFNLISHVPGEPERAIREKAYPRAIAYLRANIGRRFGDLPEEQQKAIVERMPTPGSPAAKAAGIQRAPEAADLLHAVNLVPFAQLLDLDDAMDQAQALWFLKETAAARRDLALASLEPTMPRVLQLLRTGEDRVREQALGLLAALGAEGSKVPELADRAAVEAFGLAASKFAFPPLRRLAEGRILLLPGEERDALVAAGTKALQSGSLGEKATGKTPSGRRFWGFRVDRVPEELAVLGIPEGAVITAVNGVPVNDGKSLLDAVDANLWTIDRSKDKEGVRVRKAQATLVVEMLVGDDTRAIDYAIR